MTTLLFIHTMDNSNDLSLSLFLFLSGVYKYSYFQNLELYSQGLYICTLMSLKQHRVILFFMNNSFVQVCLGKIKSQFDWMNQGIPCENVTMKNDFLS